MDVKEASGWLRDPGSRMMSAGIVLALLFLGRSVLIPLALAVMLSLLVAPPVRTLRRLGVGRASSVLIAVMASTVLCMGVATALGTQILHIAASFPQYESNVQRKLKTLEELTVGPLRRFTDATSRLTETREAAQARPVGAPGVERFPPAATPGVTARDPPEPTSQPLQLMGKLLTSIWGPLQFAGIVLLVLIFVLLEHESLRDRFIRLAAMSDIRAATLALNDAGERLSRYFVSQFLVNLAFGIAIWVGLSVLRLPQALLCGALAGVLRFVPYVGVGIAAMFAAVLAAAVDPGWLPVVSTLGVFILLDIFVGQLVEPHLYGHATGLSPLSVVVAAIFWSWLWGPAGLILSTPLTLCLLVAGRHIKGLGALELLLGNAQPLTLPQKFYQRALSGDPHEIIADARGFLKGQSLAAYCDRVMIPALHLAQRDAEASSTTPDQQRKTRRVIVEVAAALSGHSLKTLRRRHRGAVLEEVNAGRWLRQQREQLTGKWQGPLGVPRGSIVLCMALGAPADELATELLVGLLRIEGLDARHFSPAEIAVGLPPGADPEGIALVFLVSAFPSQERERAGSLSQELHELLPQAAVIQVFCPGAAALSGSESGEPGSAESTTGSLAQAVEIATSLHKAPSKPWSQLMERGRGRPAKSTPEETLNSAAQLQVIRPAGSPEFRGLKLQ